jgi:hypothetical protein
MKSIRPALSAVPVDALLKQKSRTMIMDLHVQIAIAFSKEEVNVHTVDMISDQILIKKNIGRTNQDHGMSVFHI